MSAVELVIGGLRGYRWWRLDAEGWLLSPWRGRHRWAPGVNHAACLFKRRFTKWRPSTSPHPLGSPSIECDCGFYALHTIPPPRNHPSRFGWEVGVDASGDRRLGLVFGVAAAHGRVLVGTDGWRAEMARPIALLWGSEHDMDGRFESMQARYALPTYRQAPALAEEWGPDEVERDLSSAA